MDSDLTAEDIAEELLYRTGNTLVANDIGKIADCFIVPQYMETLLGSRLIESKEAVEQVIISIRQYLTDNDLVDPVRTVVSAEFLDGDTVGSTHVSRLIRTDGELFRAPYPVYSIIRRVGDDWKIASSSYAILDAPDHNRALNPNLPKE
ncbi:MAG: hypothetical protein ABJF50_04635 [Paracoccaceae bacterium]